jgi:hypothetical protein
MTRAAQRRITTPGASPGSLHVMGGRARLVLAVLAAAAGLIACDSAGERATVDGLPVLTVAEAIAGAANGTLGSDPVAIGGWWSNSPARHSCPPPNAAVGELELYCSDGDYGITERNEPIELATKDRTVPAAQGGWLTPYLDRRVPGIQDLFRIPAQLNQGSNPIPILVIGHFGDARAARCRPEAIDLCRRRLVLDRIVRFGV